MSHKSLIPKGAEDVSKALGMSPGVEAGGFIFVTGMTGSDADGGMPSDLDQQFRNAFEKIGAVLAEAGLTHSAIVEMTSYHVGLRAHFDQFNQVRQDYVSDPFPAWTAVEVAGLRREGAVVEIKVIASRSSK